MRTYTTAIRVTSGQSNGTQQWESAQPWVLSPTHDSARKISGHAQGALPPASAAAAEAAAVFTHSALGGGQSDTSTPALQLTPSPIHTNQTDRLLLCPSILHHFPLSAIDSSFLRPHSEEVPLRGKNQGRHTFLPTFLLLNNGLVTFTKTAQWQKSPESVGVFYHLFII